MLDRAHQSIQKDDAILALGDGIVHTGLSIQSQHQVTAAIKQSQIQLQQIAKKTKFIENKQFFNPALLNKISGFNFVDEKYLIDKWQPPDVAKISVLPVIANIVMSHVQNFLKIQIQIDPFTKKLIKMPDQHQTVLQFVTSLSQFSILQQFALLDSQYGMNRLNFHNKRQLWQPVLKHVLTQLQRLNYMVSPDVFLKALYNPDIPLPSTQQQLTNRNDTELENMLNDSFDLENLDYLQFIQNTIIKQIKKKRDVHKKKPPRFFAIIANPTDYEQMIDESLQQEKQIMLAIKPIDQYTYANNTNKRQQQKRDQINQGQGQGQGQTKKKHGQGQGQVKKKQGQGNQSKDK